MGTLVSHRPLRAYAIVGVLCATAAVFASFAVAGWGPQFVVVPVDAFIITTTPGPIVNSTILLLGELGHILHVAVAFAIVVGLLGLGGGAGYAVGVDADRPVLGVLLAAGWPGAIALGLTGALLPAAVAAIASGAVQAVALRSIRRAPYRPVDRARRAVLRMSTGVAGLGVIGTGVGLVRGPRLPPIDAERIPDRDSIHSAIAAHDATGFVLPGSPGPISPIGTFYTIDIASSPPPLEAAEWTLTIDGAVSSPATLTYDELRAAPVTHEYLALRCIGDPLNGHLMDTAIWTGTPLAPILEGIDPLGEWVAVSGGDGYVETFPKALLESGFLVYGMNGSVLPREHGFPVRLVLPGTWGKLNVKWITQIEFTTEPTTGFWEARGWESTGPVHTIAKLWTVHRLDDGRVELGGHAYAGDRDIDRVEVSTDGGASWENASLGAALPGPAVTRTWRHRYRPDGPHEVVVRAVDGTGVVQPTPESGPFPAGATGRVRRAIGE